MSWSEFETASNYWKPHRMGDWIGGEYVRMEVNEYKGKRSPQVLYRCAEHEAPVSDGIAMGDPEAPWPQLFWYTASQGMAKSLLSAAKPESGDRHVLIYTEDGEAQPGQNAPKRFTLDVAKGHYLTEAAAPAPAPAAAPPVAPASLLG